MGYLSGKKRLCLKLLGETDDRVRVLTREYCKDRISGFRWINKGKEKENFLSCKVLPISRVGSKKEKDVIR